VTYPGHRTRQISVRRERVAEVLLLANYQELKEAIEAICELNHDLLRPQRAAAKTRSRRPRSAAACHDSVCQRVCTLRTVRSSPPDLKEAAIIIESSAYKSIQVAGN
jgi:hypothetical protein